MKAGVTKTQVGTPYYISPEIWKKLPYDSKSDVWSLGCVLYELATFRHPFEADSPKSLALKVMTGRYSGIPSTYSADLSEMIKKLLVVDARYRPSIHDILKMASVQKRFPLLPGSLTTALNKAVSRAMNDRNMEGTQKAIGTIKVPKNLSQLRDNLPVSSPS